MKKVSGGIFALAMAFFACSGIYGQQTGLDEILFNKSEKFQSYTEKQYSVSSKFGKYYKKLQSKSVSSSSNKDIKSSSSKATSSSSRNSEYDAPTFYVRMTGAFEFEIVMEEALPNIAKRYAVMDMKGQVLSVGELNEKGAHIKVPTSGAYIVKVGLGYRRINVK